MSENLSEKMKHSSVQDAIRRKENYVSLELNDREGVLFVREVVQHPVFRRPGSDKPKGWQVTIRNGFLAHVRDGTGYLLFPRGKGYLIPLRRINNFILRADPPAIDKYVVDVFFNVDDDGDAVIRLREHEMKLAEFALC